MLLEAMLGPLWVWAILSKVPVIQSFVGGTIVTEYASPAFNSGPKETITVSLTLDKFTWPHHKILEK